MRKVFVSSVLALAVTAGPALAVDGLTLPPDGNNQKARVTQYMGLVSVSIEYNSPHVHTASGEDRKGKIWGKLVPYGMTDLGFGNGKPGPWRGGANENTVFETSHDVLVEGKALPAGRYGLHFIPGPETWTVIFSKNANSWGSFFYEPSEDALRVDVKPVPNDYREDLTYEFGDRQLDHATASMQWENLRVPFRVSVPDAHGIYVARIREELRSSPGFTWQNWRQAAQYCVRNKVNLEEALVWADKAITIPGIGQENFQTLSTKADVLTALKRDADAKVTMQKALSLPTATATDLHQYARLLQQQGRKDDANQVFDLNAKRFPNAWPVNVGLARRWSSTGDYKKAQSFAKLALAQAPDGNNKANLEKMITRLEEGKDIN